MIKQITYSFSLLAMVSCNNVNKQEVHETTITTPDKPVVQVINISDENIVLNTPLAQSKAVLDDHLFGKFFYNRAAFYVLENPSKSIYDSKIKSLTLCYLDEELSQLKFNLDRNITNDILNQHQRNNFKISACDDANKAILENEELISTRNGRLELHPKLNNYRLQCSTEDMEILIRINKNKCEYTEQIKGFKKKFSSLENYRGN